MPEVDPTVLDAPEDHLADLETVWRAAMQLRADGDEVGAAAQFEAIIRAEPRLAEPRLELAHIHLTQERFEDAREHVTLAVSTLRAGGQWIEDLPPHVLLSFALNLQGEVIARELEGGDLFLVDRPRFISEWNRASALFEEAATVDGENPDAARNRTRFARLPEDA